MPFEGLQLEYQRAKRVWTCALFSPLAYLLIGIFMQKADWLVVPTRLDPKFFMKTVAGRWLGGGCLLGIVGLAIFSLCRPRGIRDLGSWWRRFYWSLALADTLAFAGFVSWYFMGRAEAFLLGAIASFIAYACCHPRKAELAGKAPAD
jgi:hypothetical protein